MLPKSPHKSHHDVRSSGQFSALILFDLSGAANTTEVQVHFFVRMPHPLLVFLLPHRLFLFCFRCPFPLVSLF